MNEQEQTTSSAAEPDTSEGAERRDPKVIKRYTNRKLYDTVESRYVTLDEIAQMIKGGAEVKIIDNRSKEDLTSVTLAQIIFEEEKKRSQMPLGVLREIIRHGGEAVAGFYQEKVSGRLADRLNEVKTRAESLREDVEHRVRGVTSLLRRDEKPEGAGADDKAGEKSGPVKEMFAAGERAVEQLRSRVDSGLKQAIETFGGPNALAAEIDKLQRKLEALEKKIEQLGK
ncbi:MAG TPA: polyhydroxyalkanoate synthesis regulator DNA-binding domain-containing protein [Myxococcales bacterium]|nr:polyhydroxyalkanoate synthesis regulator DNA-binding domain-containing protein [Myxococcales bacterium]